MLAKVDKEVSHLRHMDAICDILYHVKYQFTGDSIKVDAERFVKELRPALQLRLRFISPGKKNREKNDEFSSEITDLDLINHTLLTVFQVFINSNNNNNNTNTSTHHILTANTVEVVNQKTASRVRQQQQQQQQRQHPGLSVEPRNRQTQLVLQP
jgi:hypothetical protein